MCAKEGLATRVMLFLAVLALAACGAAFGQPIDIGGRLEPFVDTFLIESMDGAALELHHPQPQELSIVFDEPWEGNVSAYVTVFQDGYLYRMYYRTGHYDPSAKATGEQMICYAESVDGIHWAKPELGLIEFAGSKQNNLIWQGVGSHNFAPFMDQHPGCAPDARYKALGSDEGQNNALVAFKSPDGIHWSLIQEQAVITKGAFDSQNLAFYDTVAGCYREFHRGFKDGVRDIMTSTSADFLAWTEPQYVDYGGIPPEHLYTNAITPYPRAPHVFMGFPKRFVPERDLHVHQHPGVSDGVFMTSRDGLAWLRWREALIRPGLQSSRWVNRNNMTAWGIVQTRNAIAGLPDELSIYSSEGYYVGPCGLRRFTSRLDGFVSVAAPGAGGEFTTKPILFARDDEPRAGSGPRTAEVSTDTPLIGARSLVVTKPTIIALPGTQKLDSQVTIAAHIRGVPAGHRRLFSAYDGGPTEQTQGELWFDMDPSGGIDEEGAIIRFGYNGALYTAKTDRVKPFHAESGDTATHHLAATYDDGVVRLYFDGVLVAEGGQPGGGPMELLHGDLQFGEDYAPTSQNNEPFLGAVDDILVLRRALSAEQIAQIAAQGAASVVDALQVPMGLLYTMESDNGNILTDTVLADGPQNASFTGPLPSGDTELLLNVSTSAAGFVRCEIQDEAGQPIPGFSLEECDEVFGDAIECPVRWKNRTELKDLAGTPVRLRFVMADADLFAIRFR